MNWTVWDIAVVVAFALQVSASVFLVSAVLPLKNGFLTQLLGKVGRVSRSGKALIDACSTAVAQNQARVRGVVGMVLLVKEAVQPARFAREDLPINYRTLVTTFTTVRSLLGHQGWFRTVLRRKQTPLPPPGPQAHGKARDTRSVLDRLGLMPPAAKHLCGAVPVARFIFSVWKELRQRRAR